MDRLWNLVSCLVLAVLGAAVLASLTSVKTASAANPTTMSFQGKVVNANGTNVTDGTYSFVFKLYTASSGGTAVWGETQSSVTVTAGVFQVNLGSVCSFFVTQTCSGFSNTAIDFSASNSLYLGITFNSDPAGEMTPRVQLQSVPFAYQADNASKLGGLADSNYVQLTGTAQTGSINLTGGNTSINATGTANTTLGGATGSLAIGGSNTTTLSIQNGSANALTLQSGNAINLTAAANSSLNFGSNSLTVTASNFSVASGGNVTTGGTINGQTITSTASFNGTLAVSSLVAGGTNVLCYNASNQLSICGSSAGSGAYIYNQSASAQTANFNIQSAAAGSIGGIIQGATSQTADLLQVRDSLGNTMLNFTSSGQLNVERPGVPSQYVYFYHNGSGHIGVASGGIIFDQALSNGLTIGNAAGQSSVVSLIVKQLSGQTVDLLQFQNSTGTVLSRVDATGNFNLGTMNAPTGGSATPASGGSLSAGTYFYKISAVDGSGGITAASTEFSGTTSGGNLKLSLSWTTVQGAVSYKIYRTTTSGTYGATSLLASLFANSYTDDGTVSLTSGTPLTTSTAYITRLNMASGGTSYFAGTLSSPGTAPNSEHFGAASTAGATQSLAVGTNAGINTSGQGGGNAISIGYASFASYQGIAIGAGATNGASGNVQASIAIGTSASTGANAAIALGVNAAASGSNGIAIGYASSAANTASIVLGRGATSTATNQLVIGSSDVNNASISNVYIGNGVTAAAPSGFTLQGTGSSTAGTAGAGVVITGGAGATTTTGSAGGALTLQGGAAGGTGNNQGGSVAIIGGTSTGTSTGSSVTITGGTALGTTQVGGSVTIQGGTPTGTAASGSVIVKSNTNDSTTAFLIQNHSGANILQVDSTTSNVTLTGTYTQTYSSAITGTAKQVTATNSNASSTAATVNAVGINLVGATNANASANTINGINFANATALTNNTFNALNVGTGYTNLLQSANVTITAAGAVTAGLYNGQTITSAASFTGTVNAVTGYKFNGTAGVTVTCTGSNYLPNMVVQGGIITGNAACAGIGLSDQRVKKDIVSLDSSVLDNIKNVNPVSFFYDCSNPYFTQSNTYCDPAHQTGVIAQQLAQIFPDLVYQDSYGYYHVDYQGLSAYTLKATSEIAQHLDAVGNANLNDVTVHNLTVTGTTNSSPAPTSSGIFPTGVITPQLLSDGALTITSGQGGNVTIDTSGSAMVYIGSGAATAVNIASAGTTTTVKGALVTDGQANFNGGVTMNFNLPGTSFKIDNNGSAQPVDAAIQIADSAGAGYNKLISTSNFNVAGNGDVLTNGAIMSHGGSFQLLDPAGRQLISFDQSGNGNFSGNLNLASASVSGGLSVGGDVNIAGLSTFQKLATFLAKTIFKQDVQFDGHVTVAADTAGYAKLLTSESAIHVSFKNAYEAPPVVSASATDGQFVLCSVANITTTGFDLKLAVPAVQDITLSWTAIGVNNPQTAVNPPATASPAP